jgi:hypothetical protein
MARLTQSIKIFQLGFGAEELQTIPHHIGVTYTNALVGTDLTGRVPIILSRFEAGSEMFHKIKMPTRAEKRFEGIDMVVDGGPHDSGKEYVSLSYIESIPGISLQITGAQLNHVVVRRRPVLSLPHDP